MCCIHICLRLAAIGASYCKILNFYYDSKYCTANRRDEMWIIYRIIKNNWNFKRVPVRNWKFYELKRQVHIPNIKKMLEQRKYLPVPNFLQEIIIFCNKSQMFWILLKIPKIIVFLHDKADSSLKISNFISNNKNPRICVNIGSISCPFRIYINLLTTSE